MRRSQTELRRRLTEIRNELDLPADPSPARREAALDGLLDLELRAAELRRHGASPWRELQDIATAIRAGGRGTRSPGCPARGTGAR